MQVWKAFVEYSNIESAIKAKKNLDNFLLFEDGSRINIYFSNLEVIRFQNNNDGGIGILFLDQFRIFLNTLYKDYTLNDPDYVQPKSQIQENLVNPIVMDPRMMGGGGIMQTDFSTGMSQGQQRTGPMQRERVPFNRTSQRAVSNIFAYQGGLSQIDSDEDDPSEKNPMRMMGRNYQAQFQMQQDPVQKLQQEQMQKQLQQPQPQPQLSSFRTEEEKLSESDHISKFFGG